MQRFSYMAQRINNTKREPLMTISEWSDSLGLAKHSIANAIGREPSVSPKLVIKRKCYYSISELNKWAEDNPHKIVIAKIKE